MAQEEGEENLYRLSGIGARRLLQETPNTQPLSSAQGDEPQGRWRGVESSGRGCIDKVQSRGRAVCACRIEDVDGDDETSHGRPCNTRGHHRHERTADTMLSTRNKDDMGKGWSVRRRLGGSETERAQGVLPTSKGQLSKLRVQSARQTNRYLQSPRQ
eukprot:scaffold139443_cov29-Tisochrysis_lutea.AAC.3